MFVGTGNDVQFEALRDELNLDADGDWATNESRVKDRESLIGLISDTLATRSRDEWEAQFDAKGVSFIFTPIRNVKEAFKCEQVKDRNFVKKIFHPIAGEVLLPGHPIETEEEIHYDPPPLLGQHTAEVLRDELNINASTLSQLVESKVIQIAEEA